MWVCVFFQLNASLSIFHGYRRSILSKKWVSTNPSVLGSVLCHRVFMNVFFMYRDGDLVQISAVNMFSLFANVTSTDIDNSIQMSLSNCSRTYSHCTIKLQHQLSYHGTTHGPLPASCFYLKTALSSHATSPLHHFWDMITPVTHHAWIKMSLKCSCMCQFF